jgi:hypothetical protein
MERLRGPKMAEHSNNKDQLELAILRAELEIKQKELSDKKSWFRSINPTIGAALIAALIAFFGNMFNECSRQNSSLELENKKRETSLLIEAAKPGDPKIFISRAKFYIDVGLIEDKNIIKYIQEKDEGKFLPLFKLDATGLIIGYLLEWYQADDDLKGYKLKIKEGIKYKSGLDIDANMLAEVIMKNSDLIDGFESVQVLDKMLLKVNLSKINMDFFTQMLAIGVIAKKDTDQ